MNSLTIVVIALGFTLSIMLLIVTFTIWKFFRHKSEDGLTLDEELFGKKVNETAIHRDSFEVPYKTKKIQQQLPIDGVELVSFMEHSPKLRRSSAPVRSGLERETPLELSTSLSNEHFLKNSRLARTKRRRTNSLIGHLMKNNNVKDLSSFCDASIPEDEVFDKSGNCSTNSLTHLEETNTEPLNQVSESSDLLNTRVNSKKTRSRTYKKAGKINFTTFYNRKEKECEVHILRAYNLAPRRNSEEINPFVRVYMLPGKKNKQGTKVQKSIRDPFINEKFVFGDIDNRNLNKYRLSLQVCTRTAISKEVLGEVDIALSSIDLDRREYFNMDLLKKRSQSSLASIHISLCHEAIDSKLRITINEINNLPKGSGLSINPDPYVVATLIRDADTPNERKYEEKTSIKKSTRNPLFNESLILDAFTDSDNPLSGYTLVITIKNAAIIKKNETLGHVVFDMTSSQKSAVNHWKNVEMTPHEPHNMWHSLLDPDEI